MAATSSAFDLLHPRLQRWLWRQGWTELRDIQEAAIPAILAGDSDVVIAAATAGGKTEAAFLPVLTAIAEDSAGSVRVLCVSPLKALINDQFDRLELLGSELDVAVHRWHGDVARSRKQRVLERPEGVLIITPESLEALFVLQGPKVRRLFERLAFVVVDELHAFLGTERGQQLQSLLHRVELPLRRKVPRIALSATLGDLSLACELLRPGGGEAVRRIVSQEGGQEIRVQVRGYRELPPRLTRAQAEKLEAQGIEVTTEDLAPGDVLEISRHVFDRLRGGHHLIFANARAAVEQYADLLRRHCERESLPNEFWPHHGSLSRELREETEVAIKDRSRPASAVCTTTLELGIDIGAIESVAQIGPPPSVSSLRQRLGRSGRQEGTPAILRAYVREPEIDIRTAPHWALRSDLVEMVAAVRLLVAGWCEPPLAGALHLSTLVQQVLSLIVQHGGVQAGPAWRILCQDGPFSGVNPELFAELLRSLGTHELIRQEPNGELILDLMGERIVNHHSFYAAFQTAEEYRLMNGGKPIGTLPISYPLFPGLFIIFAGRRWAVVGVDEEKKLVDLKPAQGGRLPSFEGGRGAPVHDRVREEMLAIYRSEEIPSFLDTRGRELLAEGRDAFARFKLGETQLLPWSGGTLLFPWRGDRLVDTLVVWLSAVGVGISKEGVALVIPNHRPEAVREQLARLAAAPPPEPVELAHAVANKQSEKFHPWLNDRLLALDYASRALDVESAWKVARELSSAAGILREPC